MEEDLYYYVNPFRVMGLPLASELLDEEIEEAYQEKAANLDAANDVGRLELEAAYKLLKERGQKLKHLRESDRELDIKLMKLGISPKSLRLSKRPQPTGSTIWMREHIRKNEEWLDKKPREGSLEQDGSYNNNNSSCCKTFL